MPRKKESSDVLGTKAAELKDPQGASRPPHHRGDYPG